MRRLLLCAAFAGCVNVAVAQEQSAPRVESTQARPSAADPALEARLHRLAEELRCLVCQNETLAASHAELAVDLKNQIREQMQAGRSDAQVIEYLVARYGDFVLYRPPLKASTVLLWVGPFVLLLAGVAFMLRQIRAREAVQRNVDNPSSAQLERARQLLDEHDPQART